MEPYNLPGIVICALLGSIELVNLTTILQAG